MCIFLITRLLVNLPEFPYSVRAGEVPNEYPRIPQTIPPVVVRPWGGPKTPGGSVTKK